MTELVYYENQYLKKLNATITQVKGNEIVLDKTIFFGRSCGVKPDRGVIIAGNQKYNIVDIKKEGDSIFHVTDNPIDIGLVGKEAELQIEWPRRYAMMKLHTTLHIVSGLIWQKYHVLVTGSDITPEKASIYFDFDRNLSKEELEELTTEVNRVIMEDHNTYSEEMDIEEAENTPGIIRSKTNILPDGLKVVRIMNIGTVDRQADGGIHVKSTKELGKFKITKQKNKGKGNRKLEVRLLDE